MDMPEMKEDIGNRVNELACQLGNAEAVGIKSTMVIVVEFPDGTGHVAVFQNGEPEERPMAMVMVALEGANKVKGHAVDMMRARVPEKLEETPTTGSDS